MNIGIVGYWFNRGQAVVARYIRSIFDELDHDTYVLARPTKDNFVLPCHTTNTGVWAQDRVTVANHFNIEEDEYFRWIKANNIEVVFFDQNYQFDIINKIRQEGIVTIGRFVWESFAEEHVEAALNAFSVIYSLTKCEQQRYFGMGISSPYVRWGCHPELSPYRKDRYNEGKKFLYIGGYMSNRKPTGAVIQAFRDTENPNLRLLIKTQRALQPYNFVIPSSLQDVRDAKKHNTGDPKVIVNDSRIAVNEKDISTDEYYRLFANNDISLAPSRWEGLGLHLYEAIALGIPTISMNIAPINEVITDGVDGFLVESKAIGTRKNGLTAYEPDLLALRKAIKTISEPGVADELAKNTRDGRKQRSWDKTISSYKELLNTTV